MSRLCDAVWLIVCATSVSGQLSYEPNSSEEFIFTTTTSFTTTASLRTFPVTPLRTTPLSDVTINLSEISQIPTNTSKFKAGDHVRVITDVARIRRLQKGHGGWFPSMLPTLGQKGRVEEIDDDGNLRVMISGTFWTFNPMSLTKMAENQDQFSSNWRNTRHLTEVFRDDFNDQSIDNKKWTVEDFNDSWGVQHYASDDVWEESGYMFIRSQRRKYGGRDFTSGLVNTNAKFKFVYGEVEWRAKLSGGQGIASYLSINTEKQINAIQIIAQGHFKDMVQTAVYYKSQRETIERSHKDVYGADDTVGSFHTFKIIWEPEQIMWLVDGRQIWNITDSGKIPHEESYVSMALIVGQAWTGPPDSTTPFPTRMLIDYVSVHQWK